MSALTARLLDGRFVLDLPGQSDATPLRLVIEDEEGELEKDEQARLDAFLDLSIAAADRGEVVEASAFLEGLRARRRR